MKHGHVYFLRVNIDGDEFVKIGFATNLEKRIQQLQVGSVLPLLLVAVVPGARSLEFDLHYKFSAYRKRGEWFEFSPEIAKYLLEHAEVKDEWLVNLIVDPEKRGSGEEWDACTRLAQRALAELRAKKGLSLSGQSMADKLKPLINETEVA